MSASSMIESSSRISPESSKTMFRFGYNPILNGTVRAHSRVRCGRERSVLSTLIPFPYQEPILQPTQFTPKLSTIYKSYDSRNYFSSYLFLDLGPSESP